MLPAITIESRNSPQPSPSFPSAKPYTGPTTSHKSKSLATDTAHRVNSLIPPTLSTHGTTTNELSDLINITNLFDAMTIDELSKQPISCVYLFTYEEPPPTVTRHMRRYL